MKIIKVNHNDVDSFIFDENQYKQYFNSKYNLIFDKLIKTINKDGDDKHNWGIFFRDKKINEQNIKFKEYLYSQVIDYINLLNTENKLDISTNKFGTKISRIINDFNILFENRVNAFWRWDLIKNFDELRKELKQTMFLIGKYYLEDLSKVININLNKVLHDYPNTKNVSLGYFTQHPIDTHSLVPLESFHNTLALEKDDELIILLGKMGASQVKIIENSNSDTQSKTELDINIEQIKAKIGANISSGLEGYKEMLVKYEGTKINNIDKNLLNNSIWFNNDSRLNAILEARLFKDNRLKSYSIKNTYKESFGFDFDVAISFIATEVDLKNEFSKISSKERIFDVTFI